MTDPSNSDAGANISNNFLSDLAPLLTLFGGLVTKQFLSLSMGWADNILIAIGPLGIMTILVSAIRVSGVKELKTLIGRARESRATAEAELLSSTSEEVCEMWNGHEIIRTHGSTIDTRCYVIVTSGADLKAYNLDEAFMWKYIIPSTDNHKDISVSGLFKSPPNLTLNTPDNKISEREIWGWVILAVSLQILTLVAPAVMMHRRSLHAPSYGYPCYVIGTVALNVGLTLCSYVIEASTTETDFVAAPEHSLQIITVQVGTHSGENPVPSCVSICPPDNRRIRISQWNNANFK